MMPENTNMPNPEHKRLDVFVGKWCVEGQNAESAPVNPNAPVTGEENYEWLPGNFFVMSRWTHHYGDSSHEGISMLGFDSDEQGYSNHNFDNMGYARVYLVEVDDDHTWTFTGEAERATVVFSDKGNMKTEHWEVSGDGASWQPLCDMAATRVR